MSELSLVLRELTQLREAMERKFDQCEARMSGQDARLRTIEDVHAQQRGGLSLMSWMLAAAGGAGGLIALLVAWIKNKIEGGGT